MLEVMTLACLKQWWHFVNMQMHTTINSLRLIPPNFWTLYFNCNIDISTWRSVGKLKSLWRRRCVSVQVAKILEKHEPGRSGISALNFLTGHVGGGGSCSAGLRLGPIPADEASAVQNYVEHMLFLLMEEDAGQGDQRQQDGINVWCSFRDILRVWSFLRTVRRSHGSHPGVCGVGGCDGAPVSVEPEETVHRGHEARAAQDVPDAAVSGQAASSAPQTGTAPAHDSSGLLRRNGNWWVPIDISIWSSINLCY